MVTSAMEDVNVVHLSSSLSSSSTSLGERSIHRCGFNCAIEHVWGNLYLCISSGTTHVCDKNCDQRIVYDNHSSICRASRQIFPLQQQQAVQGLRRKQHFYHHNNNNTNDYSSSAFNETQKKKKNCCIFSSQEESPFIGAMNMAQFASSASSPSSAVADSSMDLS